MAFYNNFILKILLQDIMQVVANIMSINVWNLDYAQ